MKANRSGRSFLQSGQSKSLFYSSHFYKLIFPVFFISLSHCYNLIFSYISSVPLPSHCMSISPFNSSSLFFKKCHLLTLVFTFSFTPFQILTSHLFFICHLIPSRFLLLFFALFSTSFNLFSRLYPSLHSYTSYIYVTSQRQYSKYNTYF